MNWFTRTAFANGMSSMFLLILLACLILALPSSLYGQNPLATTAAISGQAVTPFGGPAASAKVRVCLITAVGIPCDTTGVSLFSDYSLTVSLANPISTDQFGNYKAFVTAGLYSVQVSLAGQSQPTYIYYDAASASATGAGAVFPSNPSIVFNTSTTASRNAVFGDVVALWSGCTGFLKNDGTCGTGGGGGGSPGGATSNVQFNDAGSFGGSAATLDAAGNSKTLTNDGLFNAFLNQSAPGANDGIQRSLQTTGNFVVAGNDYACTEADYSANGIMLGIGVPAPYANATELINQRGVCGAQGNYIYNPYYNATPGTWLRDRIVQNQLPAGSAIANFFYTSDTEFTGSGINAGFLTGAPDTQGLTFTSLELMTRGIQSIDNFEEQALSLGDNHLQQNQITNNRGSNDVNGEGFNTIRNQIGQNLTPLVMTANACSGAHTCDPITPANYAAGATLIQGTLIDNIPFPGDGTYLIDSTRGGPVMQIVNEILPGGTTAGQWQVNTTLTPDNIGRVIGVSLPNLELRYGATTNETVNVTGLSGPLDITKTACVADSPFQESARVVNAGSFSGGTATGVVLALRYPHANNFYVSQGSHACNLMEIKANGEVGSPPSRQLFRIIGAFDSTHYLYSRTVFGGWDNGLSGYANTYDVANAGATLTRNGSNVVTVAVSDGNLILSGATIAVSGCSNSSFNGVFLLTSDTGSAVTWANTGSATTTICTKDIEVMSKMNNLFGIRDAQEFPGAEIFNTVDPVTFANNFNLSVEPNTNFHVIAGDRLENHAYADVFMGFDRNLMNFQSQTSDNVAQILHLDAISGFIPEGTSWWRISLSDNPLGYRGLGGSKRIGLNLFDMGETTAPVGSIFLNFPTPANSVMNFLGCVYGCADPRSQLDFWSFPMNGGILSQHINQSNWQMTTAWNNVATSELFNKLESTSGFSYFVTNGLAGTARMENLFEWIPGSTKITTSSNFGSPKNIFFMLPSLTTFSQPVAVPVLESGTSSNTDLVGEINFPTTTSETYTFTGTYTTHPECFAQAQGTTATSGTPWITYTGTTSFSINMTAAFVGNISYFCVARN